VHAVEQLALSETSCQKRNIRQTLTVSDARPSVDGQLEAVDTRTRENTIVVAAFLVATSVVERTRIDR